MKENKEKISRLKVNKGELAVRIVCGLLAILMLFSVFASVGYYLFSALGN